MSSQPRLSQVLSPEGMQEIERWIGKYPPENRSSAVMSALRVVQEEHLYLTQELMDAVAEYLSMEPISVYEVATFYSMYERKPVGKHKICVCTNISCMLCGSESIVSYLEKKLNIRMGETTPDNLFTLKEVECLGACAGAPMLAVGRRYYENLTPEKIDDLLDTLRKAAPARIKTGN